MDLLLHEFEGSFNFSIVLALLDDPSLLASLHRHRFGVPDLEFTDLSDAHLQTGVLSSRASFLDPLLRSEATDGGF